jgi:SAM-dependent methyltransferase
MGEGVLNILMRGQDYYNTNYINYDRQTSLRKVEFYLKLVRKWVPHGNRIFELGVGMGYFLQRASSEFECMGCDINDFGVDAARNRAPNLPIRKGSYECIPCNRSQKAIVSWDVLEHISDLDVALSHIYSSLVFGVFLIGVVPVYDGPLGWLVRLLDHDRTHVWKWSKKQWFHVLERHHFRVVECGGVIRKLLLFRFYVHIIWPKWLLRSVGSALYFVAEKNESFLEMNTFGEIS